jgi:hypothetical protein
MKRQDISDECPRYLGGELLVCAKDCSASGISSHTKSEASGSGGSNLMLVQAKIQ